MVNPSQRTTSVAAAQGTNSSDWWVIVPSGVTKADIPVFAERIRLRLVSTARSTDMARLCHGALDLPYQASFVKLTSTLAPAATHLRESSGKTDSKQMSTPTRACFVKIFTTG